jgi:hypothetical protein
MQKAQDPIRKISKAKKWVRVLGMMVDLAHEALSSNPSTTKKKKKKKNDLCTLDSAVFLFQSSVSENIQ